MTNRSGAEHRAAQASPSPFVPLLLIMFAVLAWMGVQTIELARERRLLDEAYAAQARGLEEAHKLRAAADSLAGKTLKPADGGNADAQLVVANLRRRGITINPSVPSPPPPR
jgi:hypothetical protein